MGINQRFSIILDPDGQGGFSARVPALPGVEGHGVDARSALTRVEEAIERSLKASESAPAKFTYGALAGSVQILCDLTEPMGEIWNAERGILLNE